MSQCLIQSSYVAIGLIFYGVSVGINSKTGAPAFGAGIILGAINFWVMLCEAFVAGDSQPPRRLSAFLPCSCLITPVLDRCNDKQRQQNAGPNAV